jgi:hypothetical protein
MLSGMTVRHELKALRESRRITTRDVEIESRRIAEAKGDKRYYISNARLTQLENDPTSEPSFWKLSSLSAIYKVAIAELMRFYNVNADESDEYRSIASPDKTQVLPVTPKPYRTIEILKQRIRDPDKTSLIPRDDSAISNQENKFISFGYVGLRDFTMYPSIRPGSLVEIDVRESRLRSIQWRSEYERPVYFIELRDGYVCSWCELQGNQLLIVPHHLSPASIRRLTYPKEAEVVGRVTKFFTSCVDQ